MTQGKPSRRKAKAARVPSDETKRVSPFTVPIEEGETLGTSPPFLSAQESYDFPPSAPPFTIPIEGWGPKRRKQPRLAHPRPSARRLLLQPSVHSLYPLMPGNPDPASESAR